MILGEADRHTNFYYRNNTNHPEQYIKGELSSGHKHLHQLVAPHLRVLYFALAKNLRLNPYNIEELDIDTNAAIKHLNSINARINVENQK